MTDAWSGRVDADGGLRWHQVVREAEGRSGHGVVLLGFACDEGVRRNQGRVGAASGPAALRSVLANLPAVDGVDLMDSGDVEVDADPETGQLSYALKASGIIQSGRLALGLGGGHEIALASFMGLCGATTPGRRIGVLNFDAHFDLRGDERPTSGSSFAFALRRRPNSAYRVMGISRAANTRPLFEAANDPRVEWVEDVEMTESRVPSLLHGLRTWLDSIDDLYLTICLDVLPAGVAPGVSAPAARGVGLETLEPLVDFAARSGKLRIADVAELNPRYDVDQRTARTAARLIWRIVDAWAEARS